MAYAAIEELTQALIDPPLYLTTADVWQTYMDESEHDPLAYMSFPPQQRTKLHSTNLIERLNKEAKRRADVVEIFPNKEAIARLFCAVLLEQNDEWPTQLRYVEVEAFSQTETASADPLLCIQMQAA